MGKGFNLGDLFGAGKGIVKLIDAIQKGTGRATKAHFDKKDIDTEAYRIRELANTKADAIKVLSSTISEVTGRPGSITYSEADGIQVKDKEEIHPHEIINVLPEGNNLIERAEQRQLYQQAKAQINIEKVTSIAAEQLANEENVSEEPVDEDWINRFFKIIEDISNEEMQRLWGRVLAGEIKKPKSFSLRTLEIIRQLRKEEAELIDRASNYVIEFHGYQFIYKNFELLKSLGLVYYDITVLNEVGFIQDVLGTSYTIKKDDKPYKFKVCHEEIIVMPNPMEDSYLEMIMLTQFGKEILPLLNCEHQEEYIIAFKKNFANT